MKLVIAGEPVPKARPRVSKAGTYTPARTLEAEDRIGWAFRESGMARHDLPARLHVRLTFACKAKRHSDLDNMIKLALDALNGLWFEDDWQIDSIDAVREWVESEPRTEIVIMELEG